METKQCSNCKQKLSLNMFAKRSASKDGLQNQCRECRKNYWKNYRKILTNSLRHRFDQIKRRCRNPKDVCYENYGGRGIEVRCSFCDFLQFIILRLGFDTYEKIKGLEIDRINTFGHYELGNLRIVTPGQNRQNTRKRSGRCGRPCSSKYKGVCWDKRRNKWLVQIRAGNKHHFLGYFPPNQEQQAAEAYDQASLKYHGEHGATNKSLGLLERRTQ